MAARASSPARVKSVTAPRPVSHTRAESRGRRRGSRQSVPVGVLLCRVAPIAEVKVFTHVAVHPAAHDQTLAVVAGELHADHLVVVSVALGLHPTWGKNTSVRGTRHRALRSAGFQTPADPEAQLCRCLLRTSGATGIFWRPGRSAQRLRAHQQHSRHRTRQPWYHGPTPFPSTTQHLMGCITNSHHHHHPVETSPRAH